MRIKLGHLIIVSLISSSAVFSAINSAQAAGMATAGTKTNTTGGGQIIPGMPPKRVHKNRRPRPNFVNREPVLMFDVSGHTLVGQIHRQLTVYSNGAASATKVTKVQGNVDVKAETKNVGRKATYALEADLRKAGAFRLRDAYRQITIPEIPDTTVTVFRRKMSRKRSYPPIILRVYSNTFSYRIANGVYARTDKIINDFIDKWFPELQTAHPKPPEIWPRRED